MAIETEALLEQIAAMMNVVRLHCTGCDAAYFGSVKFDANKGVPHVLGVCPFCGSRKIDVVKE